MRKLQCILVDDDRAIHKVFKEYLKDNEFAEVTDYYEDPIEFINSKKKPDLVFVDIELPKMDGFTLAINIRPTPVILFTRHAEKFRDIMNMMEAIDAFPKPIVKERLLKSVEKAHTLLNSGKYVEGYSFFHTNEGYINIQLSDILFVRTIKNSHRNLELYLKGGRKLILKGYSIEYIHKIAAFLLQPNRLELVSPDVVDVLEPNSLITLRGINDNGAKIHIELSRVFKKDFLSHFPAL
jgi:DNA-binding LytR/AlgR family response regulator